MSMKKFFKNLWSDETGQSTTEYILILSVVVLIAMKFKKEFEGRMTGITANLGQQIDGAVQDSSGGH